MGPPHSPRPHRLQSGRYTVIDTSFGALAPCFLDGILWAAGLAAEEASPARRRRRGRNIPVCSEVTNQRVPANVRKTLTRERVVMDLISLATGVPRMPVSVASIQD